MNHSRTAIASGLLAFALIAPSHAGVLEGSAFASITNVTYKLQDGWPLDNLKPSITWASPDTGTGSTPYTFRVLSGINTVDGSGQSSKTRDEKFAPAVGPNIFTPTSSSLTNDTTSAQGAVTSNGISSQVHATIDQDTPAHDQRKTADVFVYADHANFVLSPYTRITITGNYATSVSSAGNDVRTSASVVGRLWLQSTPDRFATFDARSEQYFAVNPRTGESVEGDPTPKSGTFTLTLSNNTPNPTLGAFGLGVSTYTWLGSVSSVPEPETIALMLAGLGAVAAARWRKRH